MKERIFSFTLFLSVFCLLSAKAQTEWFDQDAVWYYTTPGSNSQSEYCTKVEVTGDTLIKGLTCKILSFRNGQTNELYSKEYVRYRNDSVWYFDYYQDAFHVLYDFTAKAGDTVVVHKNKFRPTNAFCCSDSIDGFRYVVTEIDSVQVSGVWLKRQNIKSLDSESWGFVFSSYDTEGYVVEKLGSLGYFFGRSGLITTMESPGMLRCYSDQTVNYKNSNWDKACDFVNSLEEFQASSVRVYPDPSKEELYFESTGNEVFDRIVVIGEDGRILKQMDVHDLMAKMDIRTLRSGYYLIKIQFSSKKNMVCKFIK